MICPSTSGDCDNPGCRHGGCQGRRPAPPLFRLLPLEPAQPAAVAAKAEASVEREPIAA